MSAKSGVECSGAGISRDAIGFVRLGGVAQGQEKTLPYSWAVPTAKKVADPTEAIDIAPRKIVRDVPKESIAFARGMPLLPFHPSFKFGRFLA